MVEAKEAAEVVREIAAGHGDAGSQGNSLPRLVAMLVAVLAAMLAVATISTGAATRRLLNDNIHLTDLHSSADVLEVRQYNSTANADILQSILDAANPPAQARAAIEQRLEAYKASAADLQGDASKGTGVKGREEQIGEYEGAEQSTESQILSFEYSEVLLQIGIVLGSVAILAANRAIFYGSSVLGAVGLVLLLNGFLGLASLPSIH